LDDSCLFGAKSGSHQCRLGEHFALLCITSHSLESTWDHLESTEGVFIALLPGDEYGIQSKMNVIIPNEESSPVECAEATAAQANPTPTNTITSSDGLNEEGGLFFDQVSFTASYLK
jgi:hypothetical protein